MLCSAEFASVSRFGASLTCMVMLVSYVNCLNGDPVHGHICPSLLHPDRHLEMSKWLELLKNVQEC